MQSIILYGAETLETTQRNRQKLKEVEMDYLWNVEFRKSHERSNKKKNGNRQKSNRGNRGNAFETVWVRQMNGLKSIAEENISLTTNHKQRKRMTPRRVVETN